MTENKHTLILALGNTLRGDDGVGAAVLAALGKMSLPAGIDLVDGGTPGLETVLLLEGYRHAIIIDAAEMHLEPGAWRWLKPEMLHGPHSLKGTLHAAGLDAALALGAALNTLPPHIDIVGVQPKEIGWLPGLSQPVALAVAAVCQAVYGRVTAANEAGAGSV